MREEHLLSQFIARGDDRLRIPIAFERGSDALFHLRVSPSELSDFVWVPDRRSNGGLSANSD